MCGRHRALGISSIAHAPPARGRQPRSIDRFPRQPARNANERNSHRLPKPNGEGSGTNTDAAPAKTRKLGCLHRRDKRRRAWCTSCRSRGRCRNLYGLRVIGELPQHRLPALPCSVAVQQPHVGSYYQIIAILRRKHARALPLQVRMRARRLAADHGLSPAVAGRKRMGGRLVASHAAPRPHRPRSSMTAMRKSARWTMFRNGWQRDQMSVWSKDATRRPS